MFDFLKTTNNYYTCIGLDQTNSVVTNDKQSGLQTLVTIKEYNTLSKMIFDVESYDKAKKKTTIEDIKRIVYGQYDLVNCLYTIDFMPTTIEDLQKKINIISNTDIPTHSIIASQQHYHMILFIRGILDEMSFELCELNYFIASGETKYILKRDSLWLRYHLKMSPPSILNGEVTLNYNAIESTRAIIRSYFGDDAIEIFTRNLETYPHNFIETLHTTYWYARNTKYYDMYYILYGKNKDI